MTEKERYFWIAVRRGLLEIVRAIEKHIGYDKTKE